MRLPIAVKSVDLIPEAHRMSSLYDTDTREITQEFSLMMTKDLDDVFLNQDLNTQIEATESFLEELRAIREQFEDQFNGGIRFIRDIEIIDTESFYSVERVTGFRVIGTRIIRPGDTGHRDLKPVRPVR